MRVLPTTLESPNPFSAQRLDPRRDTNVVVDAELLRRCAERIGDGGRFFIIEGPHGAGKSTLLSAVLPIVQECCGFGTTQWISADRVAHRVALASVVNNAGGLLALDGLDSWTAWQRSRLRSRIRRAGGICIGTSHHRLSGWKTLCQIEATRARLTAIVDRLVRHIPPDERPGQPLIEQLFQMHTGNMREVLFDLYDWWEWKNGRHPKLATLPESLRDTIVGVVERV